jgi:hypothetical protein
MKQGWGELSRMLRLDREIAFIRLGCGYFRVINLCKFVKSVSIESFNK